MKVVTRESTRFDKTHSLKAQSYHFSMRRKLGKLQNIFDNVKMRTNGFCEEVIAGQKVAEYKHTLQGNNNWRSPILKSDFMNCMSYNLPM